MTQDELMELARESGAIIVDDGLAMTNAHVERLAGLLSSRAALVAAAEREACAQCCEDLAEDWGDRAEEYGMKRAAAAIRARTA